MGTVFLGDLGNLAILDVHHIAVTFQRTDLCATIIDLASVL